MRGGWGVRGTCPPSKTKLHNGFQPLHERCEGGCGLRGEVWGVREVWVVRGVWGVREVWSVREVWAVRGTCPPRETKLHNGFQPLHERCEGRCGV